ncbi:MAG: putative lipid II flippase FtsW [Oscillospiraceae bacterium]|nr:putative lipid II flippase FtsW [Oscillospiraceae bacterium]
MLSRSRFYKRINLRQYDYWIFISVVALLSMGLVMIFSASAPRSVAKFDGDAYYYFRNQLKNTLLGVLGMLILSFVPYRFWSRMAVPTLLGALALLVMVISPAFSFLTKGTNRWLYIGATFSFQPSEVAKFALLCFFSASLAKHSAKLGKFFTGFLPYFALMLCFIGLLMLEPHLSASVIIAAVACVVLFTAGARIRHFIFAVAPLAFGAYYAIMNLKQFEYMKNRILTFMNPGLDPLGDDWQIVNSLYAIGSGGVFGRGIGRSMQKFFYIPEPYNDFIFAVMAEEIGFIGVLVVLALFCVLVWRGIRVSIMASDMFGSLFALGITALIAVQTLFNIAVVTAVIPVTGVSLPFFSYGGTSMILFLGQIGILLNISKGAHVDSVLPANELSAAQDTLVGWIPYSRT